jgi:beta-xylosidase
MSTPEHYQEGPWFYKRAGHYYLAFASTCCPEGIGYAMSDHPAGPWTTKGYIMAPTEKSRGNHPGLMDYKGKSYVLRTQLRPDAPSMASWNITNAVQSP